MQISFYSLKFKCLFGELNRSGDSLGFQTLSLNLLFSNEKKKFIDN